MAWVSVRTPVEASYSQSKITGQTVGRSCGAGARHGKRRRKVIVDRFGIAQLVETIGKVKYPTIDLQAVRGSAAARADASGRSGNGVDHRRWVDLSTPAAD
jgi:hypothetical protein